MQKPTTADIDRKLREDFRRRTKDYGMSAETLDPVLAVLFRTFAQSVETIYADTGRMRGALLEELMAGVQMKPATAKPAQTVVRFLSAKNENNESKLLQAGTELIGHARSGERLTFATDEFIEVSEASVAMALAYSEGMLEFLPNVEIGETLQAFRPSLESVRANLGPQPALFLALEGIPAETALRRHSLYFELGTHGYPVEAALGSENWWIFGPDGDLNGRGLLKPERGNGGMSCLQWVFDGDSDGNNLLRTRPVLAEGVYGKRLFVFPDCTGRNLLCRVPRLLEAPLTRLCGRDPSLYLSTARVWIKISMPPGVPPLRSAVYGIAMHAATASNVFARNQTIDFERDGMSVPVGAGPGTGERLVAPLSVAGLGGQPYTEGFAPRVHPSAGRFELGNGRITFEPGLEADGSPERGATVRLWLTNGARGNSVAPGEITGFSGAAVFDGIRVVQLTAASGGEDGEEYAAS